MQRIRKKKMNFREFAKALIEEFRKNGHEARCVVVSDPEMPKFNGLQLAEDDSSPIFNLDDLYKQYCMSPGVFPELKDTLLNIFRNIKDKKEKIFEWDYVKDHVVIALAGYAEDTGNRPNRPFMDMRIVYNICTDAGETAFSPVTNRLFEAYGVSADELHEAAVANSERMFPACFNQEEDGSISLTNERSLFGSAVMAYPSIPEMVADKAGGDFVALPISVHKWILFKSGGDVENLCRRFGEFADKQLDQCPERVLSKNVYMYNDRLKAFEVMGKEVMPHGCIS